MKIRSWYVLFLALAFLATGCSEEKKKDDDNEEESATKQESAPKATPLNKEVLTELLKTPIEGMEAKRQNVMRTLGSAYYQTAANEKKVYLEVNVIAQRCEPQFICPELTLAGFESRKDQLMLGILGKKHVANPDHVFALGEHEYDGTKAISTRSLSFVQDGPSSGHTSAFRLVSHDGTNRLVVEVKPRGGSWPKSQEDLAAMASKEEMQAAAEVAFKAYAPKVFQK